MVATPKSSLFLGISCVAAIAAVGCCFELSSGAPELGATVTRTILGLSIPLAGLSFWLAVKAARESLE
jgi:uncharacterized membrane protein YfbV (UPF0208 family)